MSWVIHVLPDVPVVEVTYSGVLTQAEIKKSMEEAHAVARSQSMTLFLKDCVNISSTQTIADIYLLSGSLLPRSDINKLKKAIILSKLLFAPGQEDYLKTTSMNRGIEVQLFNDRHEALKWLLS